MLTLYACKEEEPEVVPETMYSTTSYSDTIYTYLERSADGVYHVANNSSLPIYQRYFFGTNENWTDVAQHFDMPAVQDPASDAEVSKVMIDGFRMRIAVQQTVGGEKEDVTYEVYNSDAD